MWRNFAKSDRTGRYLLTQERLHVKTNEYLEVYLHSYICTCLSMFSITYIRTCSLTAGCHILRKGHERCLSNFCLSPVVRRPFYLKPFELLYYLPTQSGETPLTKSSNVGIHFTTLLLVTLKIKIIHRYYNCTTSLSYLCTFKYKRNIN